MKKLWLAVFLSMLTGSVVADATPKQPPNILLIVVDDLGFTDLGSFGGEIETPNLDQLAYDGVRLSNFYAAPTCSPTRSMLLTGVDSHLVGLGNMHEDLSPNQKGKVGYEGYLNTRAAGFAEVLSEAGYNTYMAGKWHLGLEEENSPANRGFDKSYALLQGGGGHFDHLGLFHGVAKYREDGKLATLPKDFYSTRFYTQKMMEYIDNGLQANKDKPFLAYLAYTAPHWPIQAPDASIVKYKGRYKQGYDKLQQQRLTGAVDKGVLPAGSQAVAKPTGAVAWADLDAQQRKIEERKMEIYAAMVDDVDIYVGQLIEHLKSIGQYENTIVFFMSDNGAEGHDVEHGLAELGPWIDECCNNQYENMGKADSYLFTGPNWARASMTSYKHSKGATSDGGIKVPAFFSYPNGQFTKPVSTQFSTVKDVMPTLLELVGIDMPEGKFLGRDVLPVTGESLLPLDNTQARDISMGWELMGKRAYRHGDWKIVHMPEPYGNGQWQLYNLATDAGEQTDLSKKNPEEFKQMLSLWQKYAKENNVIIPDWVSGY